MFSWMKLCFWLALLLIRHHVVSPWLPSSVPKNFKWTITNSFLSQSCVYLSWPGVYIYMLPNNIPLFPCDTYLHCKSLYVIHNPRGSPQRLSWSHACPCSCEVKLKTLVNKSHVSTENHGIRMIIQRTAHNTMWIFDVIFWKKYLRLCMYK